jgi:acyl-CoA thioesterase I
MFGHRRRYRGNNRSFTESMFFRVAYLSVLSRVALALWIPALFGLGAVAPLEAAPAIKLLAFGDSLTAGYLLPADDAFPTVLERALRHDGYNVTVVNAGVSGDTAEDGLARLDWTLQGGADGVILELGANDMLRGTDPDIPRHALDQILAQLVARHINVMIAGMRATPSLGTQYQLDFNKIYPELAAKYHVLLYPFFLQGVATDKKLTLADGMHPNAAGVETIAAGILPQVETFVETIKPRP